MCEICTFEELENCNIIVDEKISFGMVSDWVCISLRSEKDQNDNYYLGLSLETILGDHISNIGIKMNYCPNCGRKLTNDILD